MGACRDYYLLTHAPGSIGYQYTARVMHGTVWGRSIYNYFILGFLLLVELLPIFVQAYVSHEREVASNSVVKKCAVSRHRFVICCADGVMVILL
jgi:hypothetical protein